MAVMATVPSVQLDEKQVAEIKEAFALFDKVCV